MVTVIIIITTTIIIIATIATNNISISINKLHYCTNGYFCNLP